MRAAGQRALALATISGAFDVQIVTQMVLGMAYSTVGGLRQVLDISRAELSTAMALYRAMDMIFWLPQAEAVLAQSG